MFPILLTLTTVIIITSSLYAAWKFPHLRKMAVRNIVVNKQTTLLTIIGSMVGTALITTALLLNYSMVSSGENVFKEQFGNIVADMPASGQTELTMDYFMLEDLHSIDRQLKIAGNQAGVLPVVSIEEALLMKVDTNGEPRFFSPKTYVYGFQYEDGLQFDEASMEVIPQDLKEDEIVLSERAAAHLEAVEGEIIKIGDEHQSSSFTVKKIVPEVGLTGYRGINKARATAVISIDAARSFLNMAEEGFTNVFISQERNSQGKMDYQVLYIPNWNWEAVPVAMKAKSLLDSSLKLLPIFTITSFTAIVIGMALIINLFKMIALERKQEFGILRAVGLTRTDLTKVLKMEGVIYAISSGAIGTCIGIGIAYFLVNTIQEAMALVLLYSDGVTLNFQYSVDISTLLLGFSIGFLLVYLCIQLIASKATNMIIVDALAVVHNGFFEKLTPVKKSIIRSGVVIIFSIVVTAVFFLTKTSWYIQNISNSPIEPLINIAITFIILLLMIVILIFGLHWILSFFKWFLAPFSKLSGMLNLAFRYPEVNKTRTGLLIVMFSLVLFLTSFSGVFSETLSQHFSEFNRETTTGGYDLLASTQKKVSEDEMNELLLNSGNINNHVVDLVTVVPQVTVVNYYDKINGINATFAEQTTLTLLKRDEEYASDTSAWLAVAKDPDLIIVSEFGGHGNLEVGEDLVLETKKGPITKKIIGLAKYNGDSYGYTTNYGMWLQDQEVLALAFDEREVGYQILISLNRGIDVSEVAKGIDKELMLHSIYPLINPKEVAVVEGGFLKVFFRLFEGFNALATVIGIVGLMVVMLRVVRERRQQIGMLRAIGISPRLVYWSILIEGSVIAVLGITLGVLVGAFGGNLMLQTLMNDGKEEIEKIAVVFPYLKIAIYYFGALILTVFFTALPARKTLKLSPAEATRYIG